MFLENQCLGFSVHKDTWPLLSLTTHSWGDVSEWLKSCIIMAVSYVSTGLQATTTPITEAYLCLLASKSVSSYGSTTACIWW